MGHWKHPTSINWVLESTEIDADCSKSTALSHLGQQSIHSSKWTDWCVLWTGGIIGPYLFEECRYKEALSDQMIYTWMTCGMEPYSTYHIKQKLPSGRVIYQIGNIDWPPRSYDLTPSDFFPWGYLRPKVSYDSRAKRWVISIGHRVVALSVYLILWQNTNNEIECFTKKHKAVSWFVCRSRRPFISFNLYCTINYCRCQS